MNFWETFKSIYLFEQEIYCKMKWEKIAETLFTYETPKMIEITNYKIGVVHRILQIIIAIYVFCWVLIYDKGYQVNDDAVSTAVTKTKGLMFQYWENDTSRVPLIYDAAEIVNPPLENNAFFIMTHSIVTPMQKPSRCPTLRGSKKSQCQRDSDCGSVRLSISESGVRTGKCIDYIEGVGVCEIYGWCPVENDEIVIDYDLNKRFEMISNYTVYLKNDIEFPNFGIKRKNRDAWVSDKPLGSCRYDPIHPVDKYCPIFKFSTIFKEVGITPKALTKGGVIGILIDWDCDLDLGANQCNPKYRFTNLDVENDGNSGFNFR
ncbi:unnamed protein product [Rodentolepis nana]|uniref:ATP receptor n=1 Tax=Rodentolepis nana TaxID=102285 RepID=A0A0R3T2M0_RODNA|nr:unnamed protein product [Rodentolepis nana]